MEKLHYAMGGWIALNILLVIALLNRRSVPHARHRLVRWLMSTPRSPRGRDFAQARGTAAHCGQ